MALRLAVLLPLRATTGRERGDDALGGLMRPFRVAERPVGGRGLGGEEEDDEVMPMPIPPAAAACRSRSRSRSFCRACCCALNSPSLSSSWSDWLTMFLKLLNISWRVSVSKTGRRDAHACGILR